MKWVRCPSCHTVYDGDLSVGCVGCRRSLAGEVVPDRAMPAVEREAAQDGSAGRIVLLILGFLSVISLVKLVNAANRDAFGDGIASLPLSLLLVGLFLWFPMARRIPATKGSIFDKGALFVVTFIAAAFGSGILIFLTCLAFVN